MRLHKESKAASPKVSLILLDWSVRESFHICHYLRNQTVPRDQFEVIVLEYYSTLSPALLQFETDFDTIAALEMPESSYYHKHLMYNIGFLLSKGEIIVICDSDAMAKPTFIESIIKEFEKNPNIILHLDQFRNSRKDLYPFNYPSFEDVIGEGCINWADGITTGIAAKSDILHRRNYGACFCCKREDYIAIGGADEHIDYVGHICGPYDLTFRLSNLGREEVWHRKEFLYHTWHPGSDGVDNYLGPHDGRNMSTTALEHIATGRILPHVTNPLLATLSKNKKVSFDEVCKKGVSQENIEITSLEFLKSKTRIQNKANSSYQNSLDGIHLFYDETGKPRLSEISSFLVTTQTSSNKGSSKRASKNFSSLVSNLLLFFQCLTTAIKSPVAISLQKKPNKYIPDPAYILFKTVSLLIRNPRFLVSKWYQVVAQYRYINSLLKKYPDYFQAFKEGLNAPSHKLIVFVGNDLQAEFLKDLIASFEIAVKSNTDHAFSSLLRVENFKGYRELPEGSESYRCFYTKSAYTQLGNNKKLSEETSQVI